MKTKQKLQEGLDGFKRSEKVNGLINKATNHLFDAYRELDLAISLCDDPNLRSSLEEIKEKIGRDKEIASWAENDSHTIISDLQDLLDKFNLAL